MKTVIRKLCHRSYEHDDVRREQFGPQGRDRRHAGSDGADGEAGREADADDGERRNDRVEVARQCLNAARQALGRTQACVGLADILTEGVVKRDQRCADGEICASSGLLQLRQTRQDKVEEILTPDRSRKNILAQCSEF